MSDSGSVIPKLELCQLPVVNWNQDPNAPSVFISYSWSQDDTKTHRNWVTKLARKMSKIGINVHIDNNMNGKMSITDFMDTLTDTKYVLCVCSESYVQKANDPNNRSGVIWEIESMKSRGIITEPLTSFVIPIIKDGCPSQFPNNLPQLFVKHGVFSYSFESLPEAMESFAKIFARMFDVPNIISNKLQSVELRRLYAMSMTDNIHQTLGNYWASELDSIEEKFFLDQIVFGSIFDIPEESATERTAWDEPPIYNTQNCGDELSISCTCGNALISSQNEGDCNE